VPVRTGPAGSSAVDVALVAVQHSVRAVRRIAVELAHSARAVGGRRTPVSVFAPRTARTAAIDVGLVAVLNAVVARRRRADVADAHAALAVVRVIAGRAVSTTRTVVAADVVVAATVDIALVAVLDAIAAT
jgi:hypothetical protein